MKISVVIRTYNEAKHLPELLQGIQGQSLGDHTCEVVVVDSGSTDESVSIARSFGAHVVGIRKEDFSFGRSLNVGCQAATGDALVFVSGHCVPYNEHWLKNLVEPLGKEQVAYTYGRQLGNETTRFSEAQIFAKYFPDQSKIPQEGFFCNNANSAILKSVWMNHAFDEDITGLEDMYLAKRLLTVGYRVAYISDAAVYHLHDEGWRQVKRRFEREAIALQHIMPEVHLGVTDFLRYSVSAILLDFGAAMQAKVLRRYLVEIIAYRLAQFWGAYRGNHFHRKLSKAIKERYYYPR